MNRQRYRSPIEYCPVCDDWLAARNSRDPFFKLNLIKKWFVNFGFRGLSVERRGSEPVDGYVLLLLE